MTDTTPHTPHTPRSSQPPFLILVPGHWLGAWAWDEVRVELAAAGIEAHAVTLPGMDPEDPHRAQRTLSEQAAAIAELIAPKEAAHPERGAVLVAHSGANGPVSLVLDQHASLIERVIWVDSGPLGSGMAFAPDLPAEVTELPLPAFEVLAEQASLDGLSEAVLARFRERAVAEPGPVLREVVALTHPARREVPTTLVCCSIASAQVLELARAGHPMFAEVAELTEVRVVDLPTGHWPMWSRPRDLADVIRAEIA